MLDQSRLSRLSTYPEPPLRFDSGANGSIDTHPLTGLLSHGPFELPFIHEESRSIRVVSLEPSRSAGTIGSLIEQLRSSARAQERSPYLHDFPSMRDVFGVDIELIRSFQINREPQSYMEACEWVESALKNIRNTGIEFDAVFVYLPERWSEYFTGIDTDRFGLHDYIKAVGARFGIPTQVIRDQALDYSCRASVMWHLGLATFAKAGGTPWLLDGIDDGVAHIGIEYAISYNRDGEPSFVTCCSQVFDGDGTGLQFVLFRPRVNKNRRRNPFLSRHEMRAVISRSLDVYRSRHGGQNPERVVIQKGLNYSRHEIEGCLDALDAVEDHELVQIVDRQPYRGIRFDHATGAKAGGRVAMFPVERGSAVQLSPSELLLWTSGNASEPVGGSNYFQERREIPVPVLVRREIGTGRMDQAAQEILGLTKMDWNSDNLYSRLPVTLKYAQRLARNVKNTQWLRDGIYDVRMFM